MCQQSWAEELTPYTSPSGRHDTARTGGKHASRKATHTSSLPCEHQRGGVGTPLVARRPASSSKLWKINAYQGGVAVCRSVPKHIRMDHLREGRGLPGMPADQIHGLGGHRARAGMAGKEPGLRLGLVPILP